MPALLNATSTEPYVSCAARKAAATSDSDVTSACTYNPPVSAAGFSPAASSAIATASASSENGVTVTTGPNTSSVYAGSSGPTGASTVGGYQNPGPEGACPRNATGAPSGT